MSFRVLVEPNGVTGEYVLLDKSTLQPIATVNQAGTQTIVNGQGVVTFIQSAQIPSDAQKLITDIFALKFTDNANPCNDGNACTTADACGGGACIGGIGVSGGDWSFDDRVAREAVEAIGAQWKIEAK